MSESRVKELEEKIEILEVTANLAFYLGMQANSVEDIKQVVTKEASRKVWTDNQKRFIGRIQETIDNYV